MVSFHDLRRASATSLAPNRGQSPRRRAAVLGFFACVLAAVSIANVQAGESTSPTVLGTPLHLDALGAPKPDAPLSRRPARDVRVRIQRSRFEVSGPKTSVSLQGLGTGDADWARYSRGASRTTPFGRETIVVAPEKTEQFLTVERRQGQKTWRWRLRSPGITPRVGDDGAVAFRSGHTLAGTYVEPVAVLDGSGGDVTPDGLRWSLAKDRLGWLLELRLDDSKLPLPYVIDPAIAIHTYASMANNGAGSASLKLYKPIGTTANDFLLAMISIQGNRTITPPSGWTSVRRDTQGGTTLTQEIFRKVAGANEPGFYTFTFSASDNATGGIIPYIGVNNSSPIDATSGNPSSSNSNNVTALSVTTTAANHMVVGFFGYNANRTFTPPAGMTERWDVMSNTTSTEAADYTQVSAGPTGNKTATASGNNQAYIGQLVALKLDVTNPTQTLSVAEGTRPDLQYFDSATNTMHYNPMAAGDFTVTSALTDSGSSQVTFPAVSATGFSHSAEYRKLVLADEPLAYWRLGETSGTSAADYSGNGNTGTYAGGVTLGAAGALAGDSDTAAGFDGINDTVSVPHNAALNLNDSFTIEFWAKQTSFTNTTPGIINKGTSGTANGYLVSATNTGVLTLKRNNVSVSTTAGQLTGSYKHFAVIYDGTYVAWYVNGVFNNVGTVTYPSNGSSAALSLGLGDPGQYANDVVDDVALYQTALSQQRLTAHYNAGLTAGGDDVDTHTPFTSTTYRFDATNVTAPAAQNVVGQDGAGNQVTTALTFNRDVAAPTGMSATVTGGYYTTTSVPVTLNDGTDAGAGVDSTTGIVERDEVGLAADSCGPFPGSWTTVTLSGGNDTGVVSGKCYRYRYKISDRVGNQGTQVGTSATAKIDTSAPTPPPSLSFGSFSNAASVGGIVYYRPGASSGGFDVTAAGSSDPDSGIAGYNFPAASSGWSRSIAGATATYTHTGSPTDPVEPLNVTASNNAGLVSTGTGLTVTPDSSAPTGHSVALSGGPYYTSLSLALTPTDGSDTGSGVDTSTRVYERDEGTLSGGSCSGFPGSYGTTVSNPDTSVQSGRCYRYRLKISDRVGNQSAASSPSVDAKVDTSAPSDPSLSFGSFSAASTTGSTVYYRPGAASGQFAVTASSTDTESGVAGYAFPAAAAGWSRSIAGSTATYSHTGSPSDPAEPLNVTASNNAGLMSGATGYSVTPDSGLPSSSIQCDGAACSSGWYTTSPVTITLSASDSGSGVGQIKYTTDGSDPTLGNGTVYSGAFNLAATATVKFRAWDNVGNAESAQSKLVQIDATAPAAPSLSFSALTNAAATGQTVYFRAGAAGGFSVTGSSSDTESGVASYGFPSLGSGWSGSQAGATYTYSFTNAAADPAEPNNVTSTNNAGLTSSPSSVTVTADGSAPVSSISCDGAGCSGGWYTGGVSVSLSASDSGSGVQEIRYTTDGSDPSPVNGTVYSAPFSVLATATVKFRAYDRVGNEEAVGSQLVRIDGSAPAAPSLTLTETPASVNQHVSGTTLFYNPQGSNAGTFTVDAATSDPQSGIEKVTFPAVAGMTGGGDDLTSPYQGVYSWTSSTGATGAQPATARNNAGLIANGSFTVTPDTSSPTGQSAALAGGPYYTTASVGFTTGDGSDTGSALDISTRLVERASASLTNGSCVGFGGFGGSYSSPDTSVSSGNCYRYRFTISDNVGNVSTAVVTADAKVDTSAPSATMNDPGANLRGTITLTSTTGDSESGVATVTYQRSPAGAGTWAATPASWDTTGVADGLYDLRVVVTNGAGVSTTSAIVANRRVDNTAPSATMNDPGSPLSGTATLTATASDAGSGLNAATFEYSHLGTGPWTTIGSDASAPFSANWDTTAVADGRYHLRVVVTDIAGNTTASPALVNRQVQNNPPYIDITAPVDYINASSPSPFTFTASGAGEGVPVDNVEFFRCDNTSASCSSGTFLSLGADTTSPYSASWAQASEPEGNRALKAVLTDDNGSSNADVLNVMIDRTAPTGSITAPGAGAFVGGSSVAVSSDSVDGLSGVAQVVFERSPAGAGTWTPIDTDVVAPYSVTWSTTTLSDGAYDLRAVTSDVAGNSFNGPGRTVNVDNTGPTAGQDDPGANLRATVTVTGTAADPAGIAQVVFQRSPAGAGTWTAIETDTTAPYSASFDTTVVSDGLYDFRLVATDTLGNPTTSAPVTDRRVDNTGPTATQDDPGANLRATVSLTGSAADAGSGVAQVAFQRSPAGAGTWTTVDTDTSAPYSVSFDTTTVGDGLYDLRLVATDVAGNALNSAPVANRRVDNTPPSATMNDPGANLGGTITLTSTTSEGGSGISGVTYQYSQAGLNSWVTTPASWNTTLVGDGLYDLRVIAADLAGNSTTSAPVVNRRVDNGAPEVSISSPVAYINAADPDPFTVSATSPDTDLSGVQFFACDNTSTGCAAGNWVSLGTDLSAPYSASWALPGADGNRALRAVATDLASNTGQNVHNVLVDRAAPSGGSVTYVDGYETTGSLTITTADGSDSGSGVDAASGVVQRDTIGLAGGSCGSFAGSWSAVTSPDSVASGNCVRYRYRISDLAGNVATYTSANVAEVDTSAPSAATFSFSALTNAVASGQTVYFRPGTAGGFTVTATSSDAQSGVASYAFPALGSGWSGSPSGASDAYSFSSSAADPTEPNDVTVQNNAGLTSSPASFTVTADGAAPVSSITCDASACSGAWYTSSVSVTLSANDAGSGLQEIRYTTDGSDPSPVNGTVYSGAFSVGTTTTVKFRAYDVLGNEESVGSQLVQVDSTAPSAPVLSYGSFQNAVLAGGVLWYRASASNGQFAVTASSSDGESGIAGYTFPAAASGWSRSIAGETATYSHTGAPTDPAEPNDVTAQNNAGLDSSPSSFTVTPDGAAPASSISCDGAACSAGWYTSSVSVALSASDAASGLEEIRYTTDGSDPSPVNGTVYSTPFSVGATTTVKFRAYDRVGNEESVGSQLVRIDTSGPAAPALTLSESPAGPNQHVSGTTLFYNPQGANAGTFSVEAATSDPGSGIDRVSFAALTGMSGGGDDFTSPYQASYDWDASSSASGAQSVVAHNNAGLTSSASFTVTPDTAAPSGGSVSYPNGYASGSVTITTADGSDPLSGVDAATGVIERDSTNLVGGACDPFPGAWVTVSSPDSTIASGNCYRYRYRVSDNVGNNAVYTSGNVVKVSSGTPGAPSLTVAEAPSSANQHVSGTTLFYNPTGGNSGTFTVTADVADSGGSGIDRVSFPSLAGVTGGGDDTTSPYQGSYDWSSGSTESGLQTVVVHNNAGLTSSATFTVTPDTAPPTGQDAAITGGYYTALSVPVTLQNGSDLLSGLDLASAVLERESATLANGSCAGWSGNWSTVTLTGGEDTTVQTNRCYHYRYVISDKVGNQAAPSSPSGDAEVDATNPVTSDDAPAGWQNAAVTVTLSVTETGSGIASTDYRVDAGAFQSGSSILIPAPADHSNDGVHTIDYRSTDNAGNSETLRSATVRIDTTLPTTTDDASGGWSSSAITVTLSPADALSGIASTQYRVDGGSFQSGTSIVVPAPADHSNDGVHTIEYRSTDNAGNTEPLQTAIVRIDTEPPSGALTAPADGAHVNGSVAISASAADAPSGVVSVEFLVRPNGSGSFTTISTDTTAPYDATWDSTAAAEGNAELEVVVVDAAGQSFTSAIRTVVVDNPPAPTLGDPGAELAGTVTLTAASQPDTAQVVFERSPAGAGTWTAIATDTGAPFSADFDSTTVGDGNYDFRAIATDLGGFNGTSPLRTARVDNTAPTVSVTDPADGAVVSGPDVHVAALASDLGSGVSTVRFEQRPTGGAFTEIGTDSDAPYETSWDTTSLSGGYELRAIATDAAGNPATAAVVTVAVDAGAPSISLGNPGSLLRDVVNLSAAAPNLAIASVAFERRPAGAGAWTRIALDTSRPWGAAFDTKTVGDGLYDLRAQALDGSGNVLATHSHEGIRIDNTAPRLESATPDEGAVLPSVTSIVLDASEPVAEVRDATLDGSAATAEISGARVSFSTGALAAGEHALTGTFVDAAGNTGAFALHFRIRVEAKAAFLVWVGKAKVLARGAQRVFRVPISLSAPATVHATLLSPTGRKLQTIEDKLATGRHSLRFVLPADSLPPGRYTILVVATSADGQRISKRVTVTVPAQRSKQVAEAERAKEVFVSTEDNAPTAPTGTATAGPAPKPAAEALPSSRKPAPEIDAPRSKPLETATSYVRSRPHRSIGLGVLLFVLGAGLAYLIKIEIGRLLATRRIG